MKAAGLRPRLPSVEASLALAAFAVLIFGSPSARAQGGAGAPRPDHDRMYYDEPGDGALWAVGATYKAGFELSGTTFIPRLGPRAPRNLPLTLRVESVTAGGEPIAFDGSVAPTRAGDTVFYDRGGLVELYHLAPQSMEQVFVVPELRVEGDLVLRIEVDSELEPRECPEGLEFSCELGAVHYGRAVAIDARGQRSDADTQLQDGAIEIRVPGSFLASARLPLTIDPVVSTSPIDTTAFDDFSPDVSYDVTTNLYFAVYEEVVSAADHDVVATAYDASWAILGRSYVDASTENWTRPKVANNNFANQFLVVARAAGVAGGGVIRGRLWNAMTQTYGAPFNISGAESGDKSNPDVGGDPVTTPTSVHFYCVVWERTSSASNHDIHARLVSDAGVLVGPGTLLIDNSTALDTLPSISKSNGGPPSATQEWTLVWQREVTPSDHDLHAAQIHWDGTISTPSFLVPVSISSTDHTRPSVSTLLDAPSGAREYLVVCELDAPTTHILLGVLMRGTTLLDQANLTTLEIEAAVTTDERGLPSVDSDGSCFAFAYGEQQLLGANYNVYTATFTLVGTDLWPCEGHLPLATSATVENHPQIASTKSSGGVKRRFAVVWDDAAGGVTLSNIEGGQYDCGQFASYCWPGTVGVVIACPCGNPALSSNRRGCNNSANTGGARLSASGVASLAADTVELATTGETPTATSVFVQGDVVIFGGVVFGQGVRCVGGNLKRLYVKTAVGGAVSAPVGADPSVSARSAALGDPLSAGLKRSYYVYYRDPVVLGGCPATSTFNVTQALQALWAP